MFIDPLGRVTLVVTEAQLNSAQQGVLLGKCMLDSGAIATVEILKLYKSRALFECPCA